MPIYFLAAVILLIGIFPMLFIHLLEQPVALFTGMPGWSTHTIQTGLFDVLQSVSRACWILFILVAFIFGVRKYFSLHRKIVINQTWGCGYVAPTVKQQYTASSFIRSYSKLFSPVLLVEKEEESIHSIFPSKLKYHTHAYDKIEKGIIDRILKLNKNFMGRFVFLNNGRLQFYILYGILFILTVLSIPLLYVKIDAFIEIIKQL